LHSCGFGRGQSASLTIMPGLVEPEGGEVLIDEDILRMPMQQVR
jgi:ABC-type antimicrobial peptide transport system ATPase subunit